MVDETSHPSNVEVTITSSSLPANVIDHARANGASLVVLPLRRTEDDRGIYGEATLFLVKELRAAGIEATYLDPSEERLFEVKKSALVAALATIGLGIAGNAAWEAVKVLLRRHHTGGQMMELTYVDISATGDKTAWTVRGPASEVVEVVDELRRKLPEGPE